MPNLFINTYTPLVANSYGRKASEASGIPPFVDGSIRREPDLQHAFPSISCLCRCGKFAPRLRVGDHVVYMTRKARYRTPERHWRLTSVLRVMKLFDSHQSAAEWYRERGLALPSNCMVPGNKPYPLSQSHARTRHGGCADPGVAKAWDDAYLERARRFPRFVVCERVWCDLSWGAPIVRDDDFIATLGYVPGTRNPGSLPSTHLTPLLQRVGVCVSPSCP